MNNTINIPMNKDYPLWLKIALRLPLRWKHKVRSALQHAEYLSENLVLDHGNDLCLLIENTSTPDFDEFNRRLAVAEKAWGHSDSYLNGLATTARFRKFMHTQKLKKVEKIVVDTDSPLC